MIVGSRFQSIPVQKGFSRLMSNLNPKELIENYYLFNEWVERIDKSEDHLRFLIVERGTETPVGVYVYKPSENKLCSVYVIEEFRRMGVFKFVLAEAESFSPYDVNLELANNSVLERYLTKSGYAVSDSFYVEDGMKNSRLEMRWEL